MAGEMQRRKVGTFESPNDRAVISTATAEMMTWPRIDTNDPEQVQERLNLLFAYSADKGIYVLPSTMAMALGVTLRSIEHWRAGSRRKDPEVVNLINAAYESSMATLQMASLLGQVQPIQALAIQHSMGMQDNPDKVAAPAETDDRSATAQEIMDKYADMPDD